MTIFAIAVLFAFGMAEQKCEQKNQDIIISDIRNVSDKAAFLTCMDSKNETAVFDLSWDDGKGVKVTRGATQVAVTKLSGNQTYLSIEELTKNTQCYLQIGREEPLKCTKQGEDEDEKNEDEEEKNNSNVGVGVGLGVVFVILVLVAVVLFLRKRASKPHSGSAANGTVPSSVPEADSSPKEPAETRSSAEASDGLMNPRPGRQEQQLPDYFSQPQESGSDAMELADMRTSQNQDEVVTTQQQALAQLGKLRSTR